MLRVGIVGCGRIVEEGHAPAFEELAGRFQVVALADPVEERRVALGDRFGVAAARRYADYRDLLSAGALDLIDIAVPHFLHAEICLAAAATGVPIVMEKPMATSREECDAIMAAVRAAGVPACIIHNYLRHPWVEAARHAIEHGALGKTFLFRSEGMSRRSYPGTKAYDPAWRTRRAAGGGGALIDNGYHNLYTGTALLRSPVREVYARTGAFLHAHDVEDTAALLLTHASGALSTILVAWSGHSAQPVNEIHGEGGSIRVEGQGRETRAVLYTDAGSVPLERPDPGAPQGFAAVFRDLAEALDAGREPPYPFEVGYANIEVVFAAYESARTGKPVRVGG
ncbi:MAG: Gfo/Idh/MocA family oxidoreductase [Actinobacteria bacterium]|nr:Gfo/Idh/MocA family oxidoreductase [Actinomycetota bacterium]